MVFAFENTHRVCFQGSLSAGGNRLCHLQEEIIDGGSHQFLAFNRNDFFFLLAEEIQQLGDF